MTRVVPDGPGPAGASVPWQRVVGIVGVAVLVCALCALAGVWQFSRHVDRSTTAERVEANYAARPSPLDDVLGADGSLAPGSEWRTASVAVRYLATEPVALRNRPVEGRPAVRLLHPAVVAEGSLAGRVLVVDRGWVPTADGGPERRPAAPEGVVELVVRLRPAEAGDPARAVVEGDVRQVRSIVPAAVVAASGASTGASGDPLPVYGLLTSEDGGAPAGVSAMPRPDTSLGNNLSYAFQWWVFGLGALGGAVVLLRRERAGTHAGPAPIRPDGVRGATSSSRQLGPSSPSARRGRRPSAEEEEDALLDAQLAASDEVSRDPA